MALYAYSIKIPDEKRAARAQVHDVNASYKDLSQVLRAIKGKNIEKAEEVLNQCISKQKPIHFKKFSKHLGHRAELGGKKGKYPIKEAKVALRLLQNAVANAENKGLDKKELKIYGAAAYKQNQFMRYRKYWASGIILGYGKQSYASQYVTCWAEIVLTSKKSPIEPKEEVPKKVKEKPIETKKVIEDKKVEKPKDETKELKTEKEKQKEAVKSGE